MDEHQRRGVVQYYLSQKHLVYGVWAAMPLVLVLFEPIAGT